LITGIGISLAESAVVIWIMNVENLSGSFPEKGFMMAFVTIASIPYSEFCILDRRN
jgi:hypothetical protein